MTTEQFERLRQENMEYFGFGPVSMKKIKVCLRCGQAVQNTDEICKTCGCELPEKTLYDVYKERHQICSCCETVLSDTMEYCPQCGTRVTKNNN